MQYDVYVESYSPNVKLEFQSSHKKAHDANLSLRLLKQYGLYDNETVKIVEYPSGIIHTKPIKTSIRYI